MDAAYFEDLYRTKGDPWGFRTSDYEAAKYEATLGALARPRYDRALEIGCSIGILTKRLAERCATLLAIDGSPTALEAAEHLCAAEHNVVFEERMIPNGFPSGRFDLIVLSEVLYYLTRGDLDRTTQRCLDAQGSTAGEIIVCHWLGETDYPLTGQEATEAFAAGAIARGYTHTVVNEETYRLDRLTRS